MRLAAFPPVAALALAALSIGVPQAADAPPILIEPGAPAPAWVLSGPQGEVNFPDAAAGRPAIVLFWATWCPYCKALMPHLQQIRAEYAGRGVQVFAVNVWEDSDPAQFLDEHGYDFTLLLDGDGVAQRYGVYATPGLFLVDAAGRVLLNGYLIDTSALPVKQGMSNRQKAALVAPLWAQRLRGALEAAL